MSQPKFMWMEGSRWIGHEFWATIIIYNTPNGIGKVEQRMPESMGGNWYSPRSSVSLEHSKLDLANRHPSTCMSSGKVKLAMFQPFAVCFALCHFGLQLVSLRPAWMFVLRSIQ